MGRPLSPRFLSMKARDYCFQHYPVLGKANNGMPLVGDASTPRMKSGRARLAALARQECPLLVEYIDKIVDLRRGLVDDGKVPQSLQKPLQALESRGNPYGKMEKKRADWVKAEEFRKNCAVKVVNGQGAETLYFVDSVTSFDDRMQAIGRATARILARIGEDFGILGSAEKDSGHEVRRFGEETLFRGAARPQHGGDQDFGSEANRYRRSARVQRAETRLRRTASRGTYQPSHGARGEDRATETPADCGSNGVSSPITTPATWAGITGFTTIRATCSTPFRPEAGGDGALPRPLVLLRRRRTDAVLRAQGRASAWA